MRFSRFLRRHAPLALVMMFIAVGCPNEGEKLRREELEPITFSRLERFESEDAFDEYKDKVRGLSDRVSSGWSGPFGCASNEDVASPNEPDSGESITNNQEEGVDEGGIVKAVEDYFVILRRGRLFTVRQGQGGEALVPVHQVDAYAPGFTEGTWYDEMLVHGRRVVVIGYSYEVGATEVVLFRLEEDGRLTHEASHFLSSGDYYSSRNYASRLIGGTLVFYIPYRISERDELPGVKHWKRRNDTTDWSRVLSKVDIYKPVQPTLSPMLHTVVRCDLDSPDFHCTATAVTGPYARTFYVSRDAVYLWVSSGYESWYLEEPSQEPTDSFVYRLPLDGGEPTALRTRGSPVDQFSFRESADGHLEVLLTPQGAGDAMWGPEITRGNGQFALLRAPLSAFSAEVSPAAGGDYTRLPGPDSIWAVQNRFVGNHVLWGSGAGWRSGAGTERKVWVTDVRAPEAVKEVALEHGVDRIEALGSTGSVIVGSDGTDLRFTALALGDTPELRGTYARPGAVQGETRSHGFFFKPDGTGGGVLGLPVRLQGAPWQHLRYGSAEVTFLRVTPTLGLSPVGALTAADEQRDDDCKKSCIDWYGNARPIFYRGRIFALMGYEFIEAQLAQDSLQETFRVSFLEAQR
jgi:hypothetical protein